MPVLDGVHMDLHVHAVLPALLGFNPPIFDPDAYVCMLNWGDMWAYSATLAILVLGPSLMTIIYTYSYIFSMYKRLRSGVPIHDKEYATALAEALSNPTHIMSFVLILTFLGVVTPYIGVRLWEHFTASRLQVPFLHFALVWLGVAQLVLEGHHPAVAQPGLPAAGALLLPHGLLSRE